MKQLMVLANFPNLQNKYQRDVYCVAMKDGKIEVNDVDKSKDILLLRMKGKSRSNAIPKGFVVDLLPRDIIEVEYSARFNGYLHVDLHSIRFCGILGLDATEELAGIHVWSADNEEFDLTFNIFPYHDADVWTDGLYDRMLSVRNSVGHNTYPLRDPQLIEEFGNMKNGWRFVSPCRLAVLLQPVGVVAVLENVSIFAVCQVEKKYCLSVGKKPTRWPQVEGNRLLP